MSSLEVSYQSAESLELRLEIAASLQRGVGPSDPGMCYVGVTFGGGFPRSERVLGDGVGIGTSHSGPQMGVSGIRVSGVGAKTLGV